MKKKLIVLFSVCIALVSFASVADLTRDQYYQVARDVYRFGLTNQETVNHVAISAFNQDILLTNEEARYYASWFYSNDGASNSDDAMLTPSSEEVILIPSPLT